MPEREAELRRRDDKLMRRVIGLQVAILLAQLSLLATRIAAGVG